MHFQHLQKTRYVGLPILLSHHQRSHTPNVLPNQPLIPETWEIGLQPTSGVPGSDHLHSVYPTPPKTQSRVLRTCPIWTVCYNCLWHVFHNSQPTSEKQKEPPTFQKNGIQLTGTTKLMIETYTTTETPSDLRAHGFLLGVSETLVHESPWHGMKLCQSELVVILETVRHEPQESLLLHPKSQLPKRTNPRRHASYITTPSHNSLHNRTNNKSTPNETRLTVNFSRSLQWCHRENPQTHSKYHTSMMSTSLTVMLKTSNLMFNEANKAKVSIATCRMLLGRFRVQKWLKQMNSSVMTAQNKL